jgi:hypothetical protein
MRIKLMIAGAVSRTVEYPEGTIFFLELQVKSDGENRGVQPPPLLIEGEYEVCAPEAPMRILPYGN